MITAHGGPKVFFTGVNGVSVCFGPPNPSEVFVLGKSATPSSFSEAYASNRAVGCLDLVLELPSLAPECWWTR